MRIIEVRRQELPALVCAATWFFCVLAAYYTLRPVRETFASELTSGQRANLFTMTLVVMLIVTPLYGLIVARVARRWLVPIVYGFFIANLAVFWSLTSQGNPPAWFSRAFFVWLSVFNLFVVTLFWGTIVDLFNGEQGKRLFGLIFGAGTVGQLVSSWAVQKLTTTIGTSGLLWISGMLLGIAIVCSWQLRRLLSSHPSIKASARKTNNVWTLAWEGVTAVARSPYLLGIAGFVVVLSACASVVYLQMTDIVAEQLADTNNRTEWFAKINFWHGVITLLLQTVVVGWLLRTIGVGWTMAIVPAVFCAGFATLSMTQSLTAVGVFQVALRAAAFSLGNPALEVLYTAVAPGQKYRAKAFIDTVGKRAGDVVGAQGYALLASLGWMISTVSLALLPVVLALAILCMILGSAHAQATRLAESQQS